MDLSLRKAFSWIQSGIDIRLVVDVRADSLHKHTYQASASLYSVTATLLIAIL